MSINLMRLVQYLICAKVLAVGLEESDEECICQADLENDCIVTHGDSNLPFKTSPTSLKFLVPSATN
jgi:hypothetical protein